MSTEVAAPAKASPRQLLTLDAALSSITDQIEEALTADDAGSIEAFVRIEQSLHEQRKDEIDKIVLALLTMESLILLNEQQADVFKSQAERLRDASNRVRAHIQQYIDKTLPEDNRKLTGNTSVIRTQANSQDSLIIRDEAAVPGALHSYEVSVFVPYAQEALLSAVCDMATGLGLRAKVHKTQQGEFKLAPDEERIKEHLAVHAEEWAWFGRGRHLRTKPSMAEARKALVKA